MAACKNCGANVPDGYEYCTNCGTMVAEKRGSKGNYEKDFIKSLPAEFRPLSAWAYFGYSLLFSLPIAGLIIVIVFACGGVANVNLKRFARYYVITYIIVIVLTVIAVAVVMAASLDLFDILANYMPM